MTGTVTTTYDARIDWFGTARGRIGFLVTDQLLLYATGGLAYCEVKLSGLSSVSASTGPNPIPISTASIAFSGSRTNVGWTVGGGIEGKFWGWLSPAWSLKLEYLYVDLGSLDTVGGPTAIIGSVGSSVGAMSTHTHFTENIVRVGLNYKLF